MYRVDKTLDGNNWLNDEVIHAHLYLFAHECRNTLNMVVLPCYLVTKWLAGAYHDWVFKRERFGTYIFVPINNKQHWFLLTANVVE
jgi:Ulp1 family protease